MPQTLSTAVRKSPPADTHQQVSDKHDHHEEDQTHVLTWDLHATQQVINPLSTQDSEDDEEGIEEIGHIPARKLAVLHDMTDVLFVVLLEEMHAGYGEDEDHNQQKQDQIYHRWGPHDL